jgi:hypothetical protein
MAAESKPSPDTFARPRNAGIQPAGNIRPVTWAWLAELCLAVPEFQAGVCQIARQLGLSEEELRLAVPNVAEELRRLLPAVGKAAAILAFLPNLADRCIGRLRRRGVSPDDAQTLSQDVACRVLRALFGSWPRGNVGAWASAILNGLFVDHVRHAAMVRRRLGRRRDEAVLRGLADPRSTDRTI